MSGHSKWSTIKRQKGIADIKRGQIFTKLANAVTIAVQQGGGVTDPEGNPRLRMAIEAARAANMPKENIERAIERAKGKQADSMEEVVYEGFGPGGFSVIVEAVTDNKQRTTPEIRSIFDKAGGSIGNVGSVAYQFEQKGMITVEKGDKSAEEIFLLAADAGAEDVEQAGNEFLIYTKPEDLTKIRDILKEKGIIVHNAELIRKPNVLIDINDKETAQKALSFVEKLEDYGDVQKVYANFNIPDELMKNIL